jgi:hypothetical protein
MARRIICDICNKEADANQRVTQPWCGFAYTKFNVLTNQMEQETFDLCDECSSNVSNFIKEQRNERQGSDTITDEESVADTARPSIKIHT